MNLNSTQNRSEKKNESYWNPFHTNRILIIIIKSLILRNKRTHARTRMHFLCVFMNELCCVRIEIFGNEIEKISFFYLSDCAVAWTKRCEMCQTQFRTSGWPSLGRSFCECLNATHHPAFWPDASLLFIIIACAYISTMYIKSAISPSIDFQTLCS